MRRAENEKSWPILRGTLSFPFFFFSTLLHIIVRESRASSKLRTSQFHENFVESCWSSEDAGNCTKLKRFFLPALEEYAFKSLENNPSLSLIKTL